MYEPKKKNVSQIRYSIQEDVLEPNDDITHFQYSKKNSHERGPAVIGVELKFKKDFDGLIKRLEKLNFKYEYLNENQELFQHLI